jgi:hypothetical protein
VPTAKLPALHGVQVTCPPVENDPGLHASHEPCPVSSCAVPAGQDEQLVLPVPAAKLPAAQGVQDD